MSIGAFGENFPYNNFHDLNMDWIIKIAKDFLDQYTHIQQTIEDGETSLQNYTTEGLQQLQEKADNLEALLQAWYNSHSEDIANQLADALADLNEWYTTHENYLDNTLAENIAAFNTAADQKAAQTIASIPDDYTALASAVSTLQTESSVEFPPSTSLITDLSRFNSLGEIRGNSVWFIGQWGSQYFPDFPDSRHDGLLITFDRDGLSSSADALVQVFVTGAHDAYIRDRWGGTSSSWSAWRKINRTNTDITDLLTMYMQPGATITSSSQLASLANADVNRIYLIGISGESDTLPDFPDSSKAGTLITFNKNTAKDACVQIFATDMGKIYIRNKFGTEQSAYKQWIKLNTDETALCSGGVITDKQTYATLADFPNNRIWLLGYFNPITPPTDWPESDSTSGIFFTINHSTTLDAQGQFLMTDTKNIWWRMRFGTGGSFGRWYQLNDIANNVTGFKTPLYFTFNTVGIIGDSLAIGAEKNQYDNNNWYFSENGRWGYVMAKASGKTYKYFARGGASSKSWFTDTDCYVEASKQSNYCQCYIIGLGENDSSQSSANYVPIGTSNDIKENPDENGDTYYGWYAKIIQKMKQKVPYAKFFLVTNPYNQTSLRQEYNDAVRYMATRFDNCYIIDLAEKYNTEFNTGYINSCRVEGHYCSSAYHYMGEIIASEIDNIMYKNPSQFYGAQFIPTT